MIAKGKFLRQRRDLICAAVVTLHIAKTIQNTSIRVSWAPSPHAGYDDWKQGAVSGITYAFTTAKFPENYIVDVIDIMGTEVDTNPTIVAVAATLGMWQALNYRFTQTELKQLEATAIASWNNLKL